MLPEPFLKRMEEMLGEEYNDFLAALGQERYQALRLNPLKLSERGESAALYFGINDKGVSRLPFHLTPVPWARDGYYYEKEDYPGRHPYHDAGVYYIQEPSAMLPVSLLEAHPGEKILDLCAAPGGKSTQIAAAMKGQGLLVSNEIHPARARILSENIERMGVRNACVTNETPTRLSENFPEYFDRILVDAPCSGEGMFRKNEQAQGEWSLENVMLCARRQEEILDQAAQMLRPGGRLVYSTCTFAPEENEESVSRFVQKHPEFEVKETRRLWPHKIKGEGHFAAVLEKGGEKLGLVRLPVGGLEPGILATDSVFKGEWKEFLDFMQSALRQPLSEAGGNAGENDNYIQGSYIRFGDNIYLIPRDMPALKGLKVLRPGLHMGTIKKNRFEPSHALALAVSPETAVHTWNLDSSGQEVRAYLNGQTFRGGGEKGWYLICVDGFGLGWGKLAGGIMKNHYPKGLRVNL